MLITNIQRFSLQDGPGIRTTVFLKGCPARCPWCANPENLSPNEDYFWIASKCCQKNNTCKYNPKCNALRKGHPLCNTDYENCPIGAVGLYGKFYSDNTLISELLKDSAYYGNDGGVTFSGGECLLYIDELLPVLDDLKKNNVSICIESCMFTHPDKLEKALSYIDYFIVDVKILDELKCRELIGGNLVNYYENLNLIKRAQKKLTIRFPIVPDFTDSPENIISIRNLVIELLPAKLEIFSVHNLAQSKYLSLNRSWKVFKPADTETLNSIAMVLHNDFVPVEIISL